MLEKIGVMLIVTICLVIIGGVFYWSFIAFISFVAWIQEMMTEFILYLGVGSIVLAIINTASNLFGVHSTSGFRSTNTEIIKLFTMIIVLWPLFLLAWIAVITYPDEKDSKKLEIIGVTLIITTFLAIIGGIFYWSLIAGVFLLLGLLLYALIQGALIQGIYMAR